MRTPDVVPAMPKRVLVVEDNELNMKLFNDLLEANGYQVIQTRDGLSALDLARKQEILPYLDRLQRELRMPVVYVTHSPDEVVIGAMFGVDRSRDSHRA